MAEPLDLDLDAIEARCEAATPGPWYHNHDSGEDDGGAWENPTSDVVDGLGSHLIDAGELADAAFIAHARTDVPALVAELRVARRERDEARAMARVLAGAAVIHHPPPRAVVAAALAYPVRETEKERGE